MTTQPEYAPSPTKWVRNQVDLIESSGGTEGTVLMGMPVILMFTIGAKTGKLRKIPLMRVEHDGVYAVVASKGGVPANPVWYHNLIANSHVELQDCTVRGAYRAREIFGDERKLWWERAVAAYPPYAEYQENTDRQIPLFVLESV